MRDFTPIQLQKILVDFSDNRLRDLRVQCLAQPAEEPRRRGDAQALEAPLRTSLGQAAGAATRKQICFLIEFVLGAGADGVASCSQVATAATTRVGVMPEIRVVGVRSSIRQFFKLDKVAAGLGRCKNSRPAFVSQ